MAKGFGKYRRTEKIKLAEAINSSVLWKAIRFTREDKLNQEKEVNKIATEVSGNILAGKIPRLSEAINSAKKYLSENPAYKEKERLEKLALNDQLTMQVITFLIKTWEELPVKSEKTAVKFSTFFIKDFVKLARLRQTINHDILYFKKVCAKGKIGKNKEMSFEEELDSIGDLNYLDENNQETQEEKEKNK